MHDISASPCARVLVVEDDTTSRAFLIDALSSLPVAVDAAPDLAEARALASSAHALWLFDANLPDGSGETLLASLRDRFPRVPALALTADVAPERLERLHAAGFAAALGKPIRTRELLQAVRAQVAALLPPWNEAHALKAANGSSGTADALRELFLTELPDQRGRVLSALRRHDIQAARSELHRLKSGCGFVGAQRLEIAVRALDASPQAGHALDAFDGAVDELLAGRGAGDRRTAPTMR